MLQKLKFKAGFNKQDTESGAEGQWTDGDFVRFRYGLPEKIGGWQSLLTDTIVGVVRKEFAFVDLDGNRYVALGTDKFLLVYFEGQLFDITPLKADITGATLSTNSTTTVTITTSTAHNLNEGDIVLFDSVTLPGGTGFSASDFEDKKFQVITVPTPTTFTITMGSAATGTVATGGSITLKPYEPVGPAAQNYGYGFGIGNYGGTITGVGTTTVNNSGVIAAGASSFVVTDSSVLPATGTLLINSELMTYSGNNTSTNTISGVTRAQGGTADVEHANGSTVTNATDFTGFGEAVTASAVTLEPGLWSLNSFGEVLVATILNGKTFTWDAGVASPTSNRASTTTSGFETTNNPTATRTTLISPTTRHLIHFGTEVTIGNVQTQDDMFIRFSADESINEYTIEATNTAGSQRLQDGTRIVGALVAKENILVWTDNALYTMKFVGAPFTFGFEQVGTNCGLIGQNAAVEIDGVAYWIGNNGFFAFDGTVNNLPCSVEDYVYDDFDTTKGQQVAAGINNLYTEVIWYYPTQGSTFNDRYVVYNYGESKGVPMGNWYTGQNTNSIRTTWIDSIVYPKPYATQFNSSATGTFPSIVGESGLGQTVYFQHDTGTDQINPDGSTTDLTSFIQSYDIALQQDQPEIFLAMRRFVPDFKTLTGDAKVTIGIKDFPSSTSANSTYSPFTITSSTTKEDTRARGRYASIKIENTGSAQNWRFGTFQIDLQLDGRR